MVHSHTLHTSHRHCVVTLASSPLRPTALLFALLFSAPSLTLLLLLLLLYLFAHVLYLYFQQFPLIAKSGFFHDYFEQLDEIAEAKHGGEGTADDAASGAL